MMLVMRKRRYRKAKATYKGKVDKVLVSLVEIFIIGTAVGAISNRFMDAKTVKYIEDVVLSYVNIRREQNIREVFLSIFIPNAAITALAYVCGKTGIFMAMIWTFPFFLGLGFGVFAFSLLKIAGKTGVKLLTFTLFQERFWTALAVLLVCLHIIKAGAGSDSRRLYSKSILAEIILSVILMGFASCISTFVVFKFGIPLIQGF